MDVRSCLGADIDSNHYLSIACVRARISNVKKVTGIRTSKYNVSKLTSSEVAKQYRQQMEEKLNHITLNEQDNEEKLWKRCKKIINSMAEEVLGIMELANKGMWLMLNARLPQKTKTKHLRRCNKDMVPET